MLTMQRLLKNLSWDLSFIRYQVRMVIKTSEEQTFSSIKRISTLSHNRLFSNTWVWLNLSYTWYSLMFLYTFIYCTVLSLFKTIKRRQLYRIRQQLALEFFEYHNCGDWKRIFPTDDPNSQKLYASLLMTNFVQFHHGKVGEQLKELENTYLNPITVSDVGFRWDNWLSMFKFNEPFVTFSVWILMFKNTHLNTKRPVQNYKIVLSTLPKQMGRNYQTRYEGRKNHKLESHMILRKWVLMQLIFDIIIINFTCPLSTTHAYRT